MKNTTLLECYNQGAQLIREVIDGDLSAESALTNWPKDIIDSTLEAAFHALLHFKEDEDVRIRDRKYECWQIAQLNKIADSLSSGNDLSIIEQSEWLLPRPK